MSAPKRSNDWSGHRSSRLNLHLGCWKDALWYHIDLGQHWLRQSWQWLVAWGHQAITWNNVDLSSLRSSDNPLRAISQELPWPSIVNITLKITNLKFHSNLLGVNELITIPTLISGAMMPQMPGYKDKHNRFHIVPEMIPEFVVPDLENCKVGS